MMARSRLCHRWVAVLLTLWGLAGFASALAQEDEAPRGQAVFERVCVSCHQSDGEGLPPTFPALAGNEFVAGEPEQVVRVALEGRGAMPSFADSLTDEEFADVVTYIRSSWGNDASAVDAELVADVRADVTGEEAPAQGDADEADAGDADFAWQEMGESVFSVNCAACHQADGQGIEGVFPALAGNGFVQADPEAVIRVPLNGRAGMPAFAGDLSNEELAAVISYMRNTWGNDASVVTPEDVARVRSGGAAGDDDADDADDAQDGGGPTERPGAAN